jgi:hypothetical protein
MITTIVALLQVVRAVHGHTLVSDRLPAADITLGPGFRYVGARVVNLYGNAEAEQHVFVKGPAEGPVEAFCWIQFEHFLPTNAMTYNYKPVRTIAVGDLAFIYDTKAFVNYHVTTQDPRSDGAAVAAILAEHHLAFPSRATRVRMFYLPTSDRRTELMIIYGEALGEDTDVPIGDDGTPLDSAYAPIAKRFTDDVRRDVNIRVR